MKEVEAGQGAELVALAEILKTNLTVGAVWARLQ